VRNLIGEENRAGAVNDTLAQEAGAAIISSITEMTRIHIRRLSIQPPTMALTDRLEVESSTNQKAHATM
jgi:hypothetical protein